jgi:hypothetical protein
MAQQGASGSGQAVDPQEVLLLDLASDARSVVAEAKAHFDAAMAKSDALDDADVSKVASIVRDMAKIESGSRWLRQIYLRFLWQGSELPGSQAA